MLDEPPVRNGNTKLHGLDLVLGKRNANVHHQETNNNHIKHRKKLKFLER